jgi:hypothetical protein
MAFSKQLTAATPFGKSRLLTAYFNLAIDFQRGIYFLISKNCCPSASALIRPLSDKDDQSNGQVQPQDCQSQAEAGPSAGTRC